MKKAKRTKIRRLWSDEELFSMNHTLDLVRRMRTAATIQTPSFGLRTKKALVTLLGGKESLHSPDEAMSDAQNLSNAAADFFAAKIHNKKYGKKEYGLWQKLLRDQNKQYILYAPTTYARTSLSEVIGNSFIGRLRNLSIDPEHTITWDLLENNNLGASSIDELLEKDIGIVSPFSGDYIMAKTFSTYLKRTKGKALDLCPIALNQELSAANFARNDEGEHYFNYKQAIGIYLDTIETGNTGATILEGLEQIYRDKTIYAPRKDKIEFKDSKKQEKFWKSVNA